MFLLLSDFLLFDYFEKNEDFAEKLCFMMFNSGKRDDELIFCSSNSGRKSSFSRENSYLYSAIFLSLKHFKEGSAHRLIKQSF